MSPKILKEIEKAVESIRFGSVEIVIHGAKVVSIERKEKLRFDGDEQNKDRPDDRTFTHKSDKGESK